MDDPVESMAKRLPYLLDTSAGSVLRQLLEAIGGDEGLNGLGLATAGMLRSHWVGFARGEALDHLGQLIGAPRRRRSVSQPQSEAGAGAAPWRLETDEEYRARLVTTVPRLEGGATVNAVRAAMQFGLGLARGRTGEEQAWLDGLVRIVEFNPSTAQRRFLRPAAEWSTNGVLVEILWDPDSVKTVAPELRIEPITGSATNVSVEQTRPQEEQGPGFAVPGITLEPGDTLVADAARQTVTLVRRDGRRSICAMAVLPGHDARTVPELPTDERRWRVRATMGFDVGRFDSDTFVGSGSGDEAPKPIAVSIGAVEYQPYVFDVFVPGEPSAALVRAGLDEALVPALAPYQPYSTEELDELLQSVRAAGVTARLHLTRFVADARVETTEDLGHDETTLEVTTK